MKKFSKFLIILAMAMTMSMLLSQTALARNLDRGMITFSFDDGDRTIYLNARPILNKYKIRPTLYIVPSFIGNPTYGTYYMSWSQLTALYKLGWEVSNHTMNHLDLTTISDGQILDELNKAQALLMAHGMIGSGAFAYPFGAFDDRVISKLQQTGYLTSAREAWDEDNPFNDVTTLDPWQLNVIGLTDYPTYSQIKSFIDRAVNEKKWLILMFHPIVDTPSSIYETSKTTLDQIASYANTLRNQGKLNIVTTSEGLYGMDYYMSQP